MMDALLLSRLQFAWVVAMHILLPAFTVGLAAYIAVLEGAHFFTRRPVFLRLSQFWLRLFAVSFGMGVASGIVMPFQFGTNWSRYSDLTADVVGPLMAYEVLMASSSKRGSWACCCSAAQARAAMGAFFRSDNGRGGHAPVHLLDPFREQLDANPRRPCDRRWPLRAAGLDEDRFQSLPFRTAWCTPPWRFSSPPLSW